MDSKLVVYVQIQFNCLNIILDATDFERIILGALLAIKDASAFLCLMVPTSYPPKCDQ